MNTLIVALLIFIIVFELSKQGYFKPKPISGEPKKSGVVLTELAPIVILSSIPLLVVILTILVLL